MAEKKKGIRWKMTTKLDNVTVSNTRGTNEDIWTSV